MAINLSRTRELQWVKEGRVYQAVKGTLTTEAALQTDLVRQTPDVMVRVPAGVVIVPLRVSVDTEATDTAVFQSLISACDNDPGVSNITQFTPVNVNSRYSLVTGSTVTAWTTPTGNTGTAPTGVSDLHRTYVQPRIDNTGTGSGAFRQVLYSPLWGKGCPCIVGNNTNIQAFLVYVGAAGTGTGFTIVTWAEFTFDEFYAA